MARPRRGKQERQPAIAASAPVQRAMTARIEAPLHQPVLMRLNAALRSAELGNRGAEANAINVVIVALSDAKHKARDVRTAVGNDVAAMFREIEIL